MINFQFFRDLSIRIKAKLIFLVILYNEYSTKNGFILIDDKSKPF